ncbi:MAG: tRNA lysidine(34) synthetase TilS, partial [Bacteroidota bacterium]
MTSQFESIKHFYFNSLNKTILVGLSGGADSIALCEILLGYQIPFQAAHINYNLRGAESLRDESFVREYCNERKIRLHVLSVNTKISGNIQHEARSIRYSYFNEILELEGITCIALGHHANDQNEQFFLKISRGSGIEGIAGMSELDGKKWRPLLRFHKTELENFLIEKKINWCSDSSNEKNDYSRNFIRNEIIPNLQSGFPTFIKGLESSLQRLNLERAYLIEKLSDQLTQLISYKYNLPCLSKLELLKNNHSILLLHFWLNKFGFNDEHIEIILKLDNSGKHVKSAFGYEVWFNREFYFLIDPHFHSKMEIQCKT